MGLHCQTLAHLRYLLRHALAALVFRPAQYVLLNFILEVSRLPLAILQRRMCREQLSGHLQNVQGRWTAALTHTVHPRLIAIWLHGPVTQLPKCPT